MPQNACILWLMGLNQTICYNVNIKKEKTFTVYAGNSIFE